MQWRNTSSRYGVFSLFLHWGSALVVFGLFGLGLWMRELSYYDPWYHPAPALHKSIGILLAIALLVRIVWRFVSPPPPAPANHGPLTRVASKLGHLALYGLLLAVIVAGYLISTADGEPISVFGWFSVPATLSGLPDQADVAGEIHLYLAWALVVFAVLHALAALKHHFVDRDPTLKRMLGRWWMASPSSVRKSWKLRWSLGLRSRRTRFLPSSSRIFRVISALSRHIWRPRSCRFSPRCSSISFNTWTSGGVRSSRWQSSSLWMRVRTCWKTAISAGIRSGFTG